MFWSLFRGGHVERFEKERLIRIPPAEARELRAETAPAAATAEALCPRCGKAMQPALLVSRLPTEGGELAWLEAPLAVDGWVCSRCETRAYPRPLTSERCAAFRERGATHAKRSEFAAAEWWFTRIIWSWPTQPAAYLELATALLDWRRQPNVPALASQRLRERALRRLKEGAAVVPKTLADAEAAVAAGLFATLVELAIEDGRWADANATLARCEGLEVPYATAERLTRLAKKLATEPEVYEAAIAVVMPCIKAHQSGRPAPVSPDERAPLIAAVEQLEGHYARHHQWQSLWGAAKATVALGEAQRGLTLWRQAAAAHSDVPTVVIDAALAFLLGGSLHEARDLNRRAVGHVTTDGRLWSNLALTELLCGEFDAAKTAVHKALGLDPADPSTLRLQALIERYAVSGTHPKSLNELDASPG